MTRFVLDTPGDRHPESLYVKGQRQEVAHLSDDREVAANYLRHPALRTRKRRM